MLSRIVLSRPVLNKLYAKIAEFMIEFIEDFILEASSSQIYLLLEGENVKNVDFRFLKAEFSSKKPDFEGEIRLSDVL